MTQPCKCSWTDDRELGTVTEACVLCLVFSGEHSRRAGALEEAGEMQSFIPLSTSFIALALDKKQGHCLKI